MCIIYSALSEKYYIAIIILAAIVVVGFVLFLALKKRKRNKAKHNQLLKSQEKAETLATNNDILAQDSADIDKTKIVLSAVDKLVSDVSAVKKEDKPSLDELVEIKKELDKAIAEAMKIAEPFNEKSDKNLNIIKQSADSLDKIEQPSADSQKKMQQPSAENIIEIKNEPENNQEKMQQPSEQEIWAYDTYKNQDEQHDNLASEPQTLHKEEKVIEVKRVEARVGGLPSTKRYVILNRQNASNVFNDYLKDKDSQSKTEIEESLNTIIRPIIK